MSGTVPKSIRQVIERDRYSEHKYMTTHCPSLAQALQSKVTVLNWFLRA